MPPLSLENVLAYVAQVSLIAAATGACLTLARVRSPGVRYWSWRALLWLAVVLPLVQPWAVTTTIVAGSPSAIPEAALGAAGLDSARAAAVAGTAWNPLLVILLTGTACRLLWLLAGAVRLQHIARRAGSDLSDASDLQETMQTRADIRYSGDLAQPATCGLRNPIVLLPHTLRALNTSVRRAVLAHELVHVQRRDWAALMVEELLRAALWFNPAVWWLVDRVHTSREEVVDAEAVKYVDGRRSYVRALLAFADAPSIPGAPAFSHRRHLFARIKRLCEESPMSTGRLFVASCLLAVAMGTSGVYAVSAFPILAGDEVLIAPAGPLAVPAVRAEDVLPPPPPPPPPPSSAVVSVLDQRPPKVIHEVRPQYTSAAMRAGIQGLVVVEATIGAEGRVTDARVVRGLPMLNESALAAARQWIFEAPAGGGPVVTTIELTFTLRGRGAGAQPPAQNPPTSAVRMRQTPAVLHEVRPVYPADAMRAEIEGTVEVEVTIGEEGRVTHARVVRTDNPALDPPALEAARQWLFTKPTEGPVVRTIELTFTLRPGARTLPPPPPPPPDMVRVGGNIKEPKRVHHVPPVTPRSPGRRGLAAW